jgi:hypothetical protein
MASSEALSDLSTPDDAYACWVAADEAMIVARPSATQDTLRAASESIRTEDDDAVVLDVSDGWSVITLRGDGGPDVLARLSELVVDGEGFVQGDVAHVPVRLIAHGERLHLLVPAMWEEHLRSRIVAVARDLREFPPADWSLG